MDKHYLTIHTDANNIRIMALIKAEHQARLTELITEDCPPVMVNFEVKNLQVILKTKSGGYIVLTEAK